MPGVQVFDAANNLVATYNLIQDAINDPTTLGGYTVVVDNATYVEPVTPENLSIFKPIVVTTSAFRGVDPTSGARASGIPIANEVVLTSVFFQPTTGGHATINGFMIDATMLPVPNSGTIAAGAAGFLDQPFLVVTNNIITHSEIGLNLVDVRSPTVQGNYFDALTRVAMISQGLGAEIGFNVYANSANGSDFNADLLLSGDLGGAHVHDNVFKGPTVGATPKGIIIFDGKNVTIDHNHYTGVNGIDIWRGDSTIIINEAAANFAITGSYVLLHPNALGVSIDPTFLDIGGTYVLSDGANLAADTAPDQVADGTGTGIFADLGDALQGSVDGSKLLVSNDDFGAVKDNLDKTTVVAGSGATADLTMGAHAKTLTLAGTGGLDVEGSSAANTIKGNSGSNDICGNGGNDKIDAGAGKDIVCGGRGTDTLTGGAGRDIFDYNKLAESSVAAHDRITDFRHGTDKIDLSGIDAVSGTKKNEAFHFIGSSDFTGHKGELHIVIHQHLTIIEGDVNGDAHPDLQIIDLGGVGNPTRADFIL